MVEGMTREEIKKRMDELEREYVETRDPEEEIYRLACLLIGEASLI
jgi:hypothetical protein